MSWETKALQLLDKLMQRKESDFFRHPVQWEELGLTDYPLIIKQPMDLSTARNRLEKGKYRKPSEFSADIRLITLNGMTYNAAGSKVYAHAKALTEYFESQWSSIVRQFGDEDLERPPTNDEMREWAERCHRISPDELGKIVNLLDQLCPNALIKKVETNEVEINVDLVSGRAFREVLKILDECQSVPLSFNIRAASQPAKSSSSTKREKGAR